MRFLSSVVGQGDHEVDMVYVQEVAEEMPEGHYEIAEGTQEKKGVAAPGSERKEILGEMAEVAESESLSVSQVGLKGDPAEQILTKGRVGGYDLISMGSGGRGIFTKELLGLVTNRVLKESPISVMGVKGDQEECRSVLLCTEGGEDCPGVFEFAGRLLEGGDFDVTTLHVAESFPRLRGYMETVEDELQQVADEFKPTEEEYIQEGLDRLREHGLDSEQRHREGEFGEQVLEEAREGVYDLVVLGSHFLDEGHLKGDKVVPIVRDLEQSFLLVR